MTLEVHGLDRFYATPEGALTARLLRDRLALMWPVRRGDAVLGLGYASPFLRLWRPQAVRCIALVPGHLPRWRWPRGAASATAVGPEDALPFPDLSFDRVLLVHGLEHAENARRLLREAWRVLRDDGRLIVVAPNRIGLWAHLDHTPFGHGHPYSGRQLEALLRRQMFRVTQRDTALFVPPFRHGRGGDGWERVGRRLLPALAGVMLFEAEKDCFAAIPAGAVPARRRVVASEGV